MTTTQEQKDNKIVAKFMGLAIITDGISYFDTNYKPLKNYNKDWNYLMEVVEKIKDINQNSDEETFRKAINLYKTNYHTIFDLKITVEKNTVYSRCLDFIKWYNEQKKEE